MKHLLILALIFLIATPFIHGQRIEEPTDKTPQNLHDMYIQKHKTNKTAGWITLGTGVAMSITGILINGTQGLSDTPDKGVGLAYAGGAVALLSTPFFIASGKNKRKTNLALKNASLSFGNRKFEQPNFLVVSVSIPF